MQDFVRFLQLYFVLFGVLALIALIHGASLMAIVITLPLLGAPGFVVAAAPTILLYSIALLPLGIALAAPYRRLWLIPIGLALPAALALGPPLLSRQQATAYVAAISADDLSRPAAAKPGSIELVGDPESGLFGNEIVGDKQASCNALCRRLLFNGEADWVRMTRASDPGRRGAENHSATYRLEHRELCPQVYPDTTHVEDAVRDRLLAGDCLIVEAGGDAVPDAIVKLATRYSSYRYPPAPPQGVPGLVRIKSIKQLEIDSREGGKLAPVRRQTEITADPLARPFYIWAEFNLQGGYNGPAFGRDEAVTKPIDLTQALRETFGYQLADIARPPAEDARKVAERILALPPDASPAFTSPQQDMLGKAMSELAAQQMVSDEDVEFVRRVVGDRRVTDGKVTLAIERLFRGFPARFEPLIPTVLDRMAARNSNTNYNSHLGWAMSGFSVDSLRPYRDKMVGLVQDQSDSSSYGLLVRLAELGGDDALKLVTQRLDVKRVNEFAAIAMCRASAETWPLLEPAVVAHLASATNHRLGDEDAPLLLALVRFGEKPQALDLVRKRGPDNAAGVIERLEALEPGFEQKHCRDWL